MSICMDLLRALSYIYKMPYKNGRYTKPTAAKRLSMLTPGGLEMRILDAIPNWKKWSRILRHVYILLPSHGDLDSIAEALNKDVAYLQGLIDKNKFDFKKYFDAYASSGEYPIQKSRGIPLKHSHLVEQVANESTITSLIRLETGSKSSLDQKVVEDAGWLLNIKHDSEKYRQYIESNTGKYRRKLDSHNEEKESSIEDSGLLHFEQTIDPEEISTNGSEN